jgi:hypothetical protein
MSRGLWKREAERVKEMTDLERATIVDTPTDAKL